MTDPDKPLPNSSDSYSSGNQNKLEPDDFYYSEEGYIVFTAKYLLKRGYCCKSGCKHCPYGYNPKTGNFDKK